MATSASLPVVRIAQQRAQGLLQDAHEFVERWSAPPDGWDVWAPPLYRRAAEDGMGVLLTGDAAEALFHTRFSLIGDRFRAGRLLDAHRLARQTPFGLFYPPPRVLLQILRHEVFPVVAPGAGSRLERMWGRQHEPRWLRAEIVRLLRESTGPTPSTGFSGPLWWRKAAYDLTLLQPCFGLLRHLRRRGEGAGLSSRTPFVDIDLVRLMLRLPPELGFSGVLTKPLLRAVSRGYVTDSVRLRPLKTLWNSLVIDLVAGDDWPEIRSLLIDPSAEISRFVRHDRFAGEMLGRPPTANAAAFLWAADLIRLAGLEVWLRREAGWGQKGPPA